MWRILQFLRSRKTDYQLTFGSVSGKRVLTDMAKFCRAFKSTYNADPYIAARLDGRREMWLRIQDHLCLTPEELSVIYGATLHIGESDGGPE